MEAARNPKSMASWIPLDVDTKTDPVLPLQDEVANIEGLNPSVEALHASFHDAADHLNEVQSMHTQVLISAGMLPESHLAETEPTRQLKWMVEALHGTINPDGLTIPLLGVTAEDVAVFTKKEGESTLLRLVISDGENEPLEREMPLPDSSEAIRAHYINGRLHLRW